MEDGAAAIAVLEALNPDIDPLRSRSVFSATYTLASARSITVYNAMYLELAHRLNCPLLSLDVELNQAAVAHGVRLFP